MSETRQALINANVAAWNDPPATPNTAPIYRSARRGEVVTMPAAEYDRLSGVTVTRHYPAPGPGGGTQARIEPSVLDPDAPKVEASTHADMAARIAQLEAELAQARADQPPAPAPAPEGPVEVALPPSVSGVRLPPGSDIGAVGVVGMTAPGAAAGAGVATSADLADLTVEQTIAHLNQHPEDVDRVATAEEARPRPRTGVLSAIEAIREAQADQADTSTSSTPTP